MHIKKVVMLALVLIVSFAIPLNSAKIHIDIGSSGFSKLKIAMPALLGPADLTSSTWRLIEKDIKISGVFDLVDPKIYIIPDTVSGIQPESLSGWRTIGAEFVITGSIEKKENKVELSIQAIDTSNGKILINKTYKTSEKTMYMAVHAFMDDLLSESFGLPKIFSSKIACIAEQKTGERSIHIIYPDGTGNHEIKGLGDLILNPAWSPSGKILAFLSYKMDNPDLYTLDLKSKEMTPIASYRGINSSPAFHPDGKRIACTLSKDGNADIYMVSLDDKIPVRLTDHWSTDTSPNFSPDGKKIVFCSDRGGNPQIYIKDLNTKKIKRITFRGKYNSEPVFSPTGEWIAFTHRTANYVFHIALIRPDGTSIRILPGTNRGDESPSFSPDGRLIVFNSTYDGNLYITDLLGNPPVKITLWGYKYKEPCWSAGKR